MFRTTRSLVVLTFFLVSFIGVAAAKSNTTTTVASSLNPSTYGTSVGDLRRR